MLLTWGCSNSSNSLSSLKGTRWAGKYEMESGHSITTIDTYDYWYDCDYAVHAFYIIETGKFVYLEDNVHGNPSDFLDGLKTALVTEGHEVEVVKRLLIIDGCEYDRELVGKLLQGFQMAGG